MVHLAVRLQTFDSHVLNVFKKGTWINKTGTGIEKPHSDAGRADRRPHTSEPHAALINPKNLAWFSASIWADLSQNNSDFP
jgi:hypothetical protein